MMTQRPAVYVWPEVMAPDMSPKIIVGKYRCKQDAQLTPFPHTFPIPLLSNIPPYRLIAGAWKAVRAN